MVFLCCFSINLGEIEVGLLVVCANKCNLGFRLAVDTINDDMIGNYDTWSQFEERVILLCIPYLKYDILMALEELNCHL